MNKHRRISLLAALILTPLVLGATASSALAKDRSGFHNRHYQYNEQFTRKPADAQDPAGNSVAGNCGGTWPNARVKMKVRDNFLGSKITIDIRNARPHTLYTYWLRLKGNAVSPEGTSLSFGGSPLTNGGSTPLAASWSLPGLLQATGAGNGQLHVANGVTTNRKGNAKLRIQLDFPFFGGAYPFQNMSGFDPQDPRFPASVENPAIYPVAIVDPRDPGIDAPFMIRMVSHCSDELGHGLTPGAREPWFDYP